MTRHDSSEDYLEAILSIRSKRGFCRNVDIAEHLGLSRPSVTKAVARLSNISLVEVVDRDVRLTAAGERLAEETLAKHTGQDVEKIRRDIEVDTFLTAPEAKEYGIVDEVLEHRQ